MKRVCDGCHKESQEEDQNTCCSSHVDLSDFSCSEEGCWDDQFYCPDCLNEEGFCQKCDEVISKSTQIRIGKYLDTNDKKYKG